MDFIRHLREKYCIDLNEQQQKAVLQINGPILLLAVPGGGKTTVIVSRCGNMILNHSINPDNILTLTFSKASALDMKNRFQKVFGSEVHGSIHFSTIHSFCYSVLRTYLSRKGREFPQIIEDESAPVTKSQLLKQIYLKFNNEYINDDKLEELSNAICFVKNMMLTEEQIDKSKIQIKQFIEIFRAYEEFKRANKYIDYDDMLSKTLEIFNCDNEFANMYRAKYKYINVDESQDTSLLQHEIIKCLAKPRNNIFMVGDEDQSIYTFRAAFPKALLDFKKTYPGAQVLLMERNYRSTNNIVGAANLFIKQNKERYKKNMYAESSEGASVKNRCLQDKNDQYKYIAEFLKKEEAYSDTAVLYRNNISAIPLVDVLEKEKIPFYLREYKTHFFRHWVTTDIISFLNLSINPEDINAFGQVYYKMNAYLSKAMFEYVANNIGYSRNLFDTLLLYPDANPKFISRIREIKQSLGKISRMNPVKAIESIENALSYGEYLKRMGKDGGYSFENLIQMVNSLKSIASHTNTIDGFLDRLDNLHSIMESAKYNKGKNAVTLSTIHSSKGLEFEKVFIIDLFDGQFPSAASISEYEEDNKTLMEEEVRLFYVGATRAKKYLELMTARSINGELVKPSRFIAQLLPPAPGKQPAKPRGNKHPDVNLDVDKILSLVVDNNLHTGKFILHKKFGVGDIRFINAKQDLLEINFVNCGLKALSLKTCIESGLISTIEDQLP